MLMPRTVHAFPDDNWQNQIDNTEVTTRMLYFFISYALLLVFNYFFLTAAIQAHIKKYYIHPLPPKPFLFFIQLFIVLLLGFLGLYGTVQDLWTPRAWLYYFFANFLLALHTFLYQTAKGFTIFATCICSLTLAFILSRFFLQTNEMEGGFQKTMIRNLIGVGIAWAIVWMMISIGQWVVHDLGMSKEIQSILFFIFTLVLLIGCIFYNHQEDHKWSYLYGYCYSATTCLLLTAIAACENLSSNR